MMITSTGSPTLPIPLIQSDRDTLAVLAMKGTYAIDWTLPIGTPIYAAREGRVLHLKEDSNVAGLTEEYTALANFVLIGHEDGSQANYAHLQAKRGIGRSGRLGKSGPGDRSLGKYGIFNRAPSSLYCKTAKISH